MRSPVVVGWFLACVAMLAPAASTQQNGDVKLELLRTFGADDGLVAAAAFSPDGKSLALANGLGDLHVFDLPARTLRWRVPASDEHARELAFSADSSRLACCGRDLTVHDAKTGRVRERIEGAVPHGFDWHPDGKRYAYGSGRSAYLSGNKMDLAWVDFKYPVRMLRLARDGVAYVVENDGRLWRITEGSRKAELLCTHGKHGDENVETVAVRYAAGKLFDLGKNRELRCGDKVFATPGRGYSLAVSKDARSFAVGTGDKVVRWWTQGGDSFRDIQMDDYVGALAFHPDGETLFIATGSGHGLHVAGKAPVEVPSMSARIKGLTMTPDGTLVAVKGREWRLHPTSGGASTPLANALSVAPGRRGSELIVQEAERLVVLDARSHREVSFAKAGSSWRSQNGAGPGDLVFSGSALFDRDGNKVREMPKGVLMHNYTTFAHAKDGSWVVGGGSGIEGDLGGFVVTDKDGKVRGFLDDGPVYTLAFSPDSTRIYYGCGHGVSSGMGPPGRAFRVVDAQTLKLIDDKDANVTEWRFLDEKRALVCCDRELQVWDVASLKVLQTVPLDGPCYGFHLSDDCHTFAIARRREVRVYRLHY